MQRIVAAPRKVAVDGDQVLHAAHLGRENDALVRQAELLGAPRAAERRQRHGVARDLLRSQRVGTRGVFVHQPRQQVRIQTSPVHTDAHRLVITAGGFDHFRELRIALAAAADVAGVDAVLGERGSAVRMLAQQLVAVEVEVADQRHADAGALEALADGRDRRGGFAGVNRNAHQLGAGACEGLHLRGGALDIRGVGIGHRLNHDGRTAADADGANGHLHGRTTGDAHGDAAICGADSTVATLGRHSRGLLSCRSPNQSVRRESGASRNAEGANSARKRSGTRTADGGTARFRGASGERWIRDVVHPPKGSGACSA